MKKLIVVKKLFSLVFSLNFLKVWNFTKKGRKILEFQKKNSSKAKVCRRHFQLLELMVAVFILLICIAPTMRIFTNIYRSQQEIVRENQKDHLVHLVHAKLTEMLYKRQISFETLEQEEIPLPSDLIEELNHSFFKCSGKLHIRPRTPKGQINPSEYLCKLEITLKDELKKQNDSSQNPLLDTYECFIYVDTQPNEGDEDEEEEGQEEDNIDEEDQENEESEEMEEEEEDDDVPAKAPIPRGLKEDAKDAKTRLK